MRITINKIVLGLLSHSMAFIDKGSMFHVIDTETGELLYRVSPSLFMRILAEVKDNEWEYAHAH